LNLDKWLDFLSTFEHHAVPTDLTFGKLKYKIQMQNVANYQQKDIKIEIGDLERHFRGDIDFVNRVLRNTKRYVTLFHEAIDKLMPEQNVNSPAGYEETVTDILCKQRKQNIESNLDNTNGNYLTSNDPYNNLPPELQRNYELYIIRGMDEPKTELKMREINAETIGSLVTFRGIVTRTTEIRPCIEVACYSCEACGNETYQTVHNKEFKQLDQCPAPTWVRNDVRGKLFLQVRGSKFVSHQDIKVQELSDQVPIGHVPRTLKLQAKGLLVGKCSPGDIIQVTGIHMPIPYSGFKGMKAGLIHDTFIECFEINKQKKSYKEYNVSHEMMEKVKTEISSHKHEMYERLAESIAPEIYGHLDIKKSLLLSMVGGVTKEMKDGMKIRGNINTLLMGDPGVAKSQLLKIISSLAPRGVYTTGKGSSGVGLTAAVSRDAITNEMVLEGGALVLGDMGIWWIDEFDKMAESDRTNIHEVMEQQTVSIAKAGITCSLNARTTIVAAANPIYGRYNTKLWVNKNINLPAALMSRFDIIFLILDEADEEEDSLLARHVAYVHRNNTHPPLKFQPYSHEFIRAYISSVIEIEPIIPKDIHNFIVSSYVDLKKRHFSRNNDQYYKSNHYITPRTLLGIIRISQSLAKLRQSEVVCQEDVEEALRLLESSRHSVDKEKEVDEQLNSLFNENIDTLSKIFSIVRDLCSKNAGQTVEFNKAEKAILKAGFKQDDFFGMLEQYTNLNVLYISQTNETISLL
jgi:DNA replication licensing factor MCM7